MTRVSITNLVEFPAVGLGAARFRCQLMSSHTDAQLAQAARDISQAVALAQSDVDDAAARTEYA